ncbi:hypothetical protein [Streptomyces sennicomposti]
MKLTFVQVHGEADGYCVSDENPVTSPTMITGLPHSGRQPAITLREPGCVRRVCVGDLLPYGLRRPDDHDDVALPVAQSVRSAVARHV